MAFIAGVLFMFNPPASKHTPLPINAMYFLEFLFPVYVILAKTG